MAQGEEEKSAIIDIKYDKHYYTRGGETTRKNSSGFPKHFLERFTHRQFGLEHADFSDVAFKVCPKKRKKAIDSAFTFRSPPKTGNMLLD